MYPLSSYEVEQICEEAYYHALGLMSTHEYAEDILEFQDFVEADYNRMAKCQLDYRITPNNNSIFYKWRTKLRLESKEWYEENVIKAREEEKARNRREKENRKREEEEKERKRKLEQEEREREWEREIRQKVKTLNEKLRNNDNRIQDSVRKALESNSITELANVSNALDEELKNISKDISKLPEYYQDECEDWKKRIVNYKKQLDQQISILEEEERIAKRKAQEDLNRSLLAQIQAQWRGQQTSPSISSSSLNSEDPKENGKSSCPNCGGSIGLNAKFCSNCGSKLITVCPQCGASIKSTAKFCSSCGTKISIP